MFLRGSGFSFSAVAARSVGRQLNIPKRVHLIRGLHISPQFSTDGVYKALTEMRIRTPFIEALKKKRQEGPDPTRSSEIPATPRDRDLTPKKMSESFTRVVCGNSLRGSLQFLLYCVEAVSLSYNCCYSHIIKVGVSLNGFFNTLHHRNNLCLTDAALGYSPGSRFMAPGQLSQCLGTHKVDRPSPVV